MTKDIPAMWKPDGCISTNASGEKQKIVVASEVPDTTRGWAWAKFVWALDDDDLVMPFTTASVTFIKARGMAALNETNDSIEKTGMPAKHFIHTRIPAEAEGALFCRHLRQKQWPGSSDRFSIGIRNSGGNQIDLGACA